MENRESFKKRNKLLVYLLIATGNWNLGFDGLDISPTLRRLLNVCFTILNVMYTISMAGILSYSLTAEAPSREKFMETLVVNITGLQFVSCLLFFVMRRDNFRRYIQLWDDSFKNDPFPDADRKFYDGEQFKNKVGFFAMMSALVVMNLAYYLSFLVSSMKEVDGERVLPLSAKFPFDHLKSPAFEIVVILQTAMSLAWSFKIIGFAMVFYFLVSQQTAKMKHLAFWLKKLFDPISMPSPSSSSPTSEPDEESEEVQAPTAMEKTADQRVVPENKIVLPLECHRLYPWALKRTGKTKLRVMMDPPHDLVKKRLRLWVQHHQQAIRTAREMNELLSRVLMEKILLAPLVLCYLVYITFDNKSNLNGRTFLCAVAFMTFYFAELFMFCHYGENLVAAHARLAEATATTKWAEMRSVPVIGSSLQIIEIGVTIPMHVKAFGIVPISTTVFIDIIKRAYTAFWVVHELQHR